MRLAALEQDLALQLEEIGIVRIGREQRVGLRLGFVRIAAEVIGVSARVMRRDALVAFRIFDHRLLRIDEAEELGLHPLEPRLERRIDRLVPGGIGSAASAASAWMRSDDSGWVRSKLSLE